MFVYKCYLSYCYSTNLSKVNPSLCTRAVVIPGRRIYQTVWIFCLALISAALIRFGWWGVSSSYIFLLWPSWLAFRPEIFGFTRCIFQHLGYSLLLASLLRTFRKSLEGFAPFLRVPFDFFIFDIFWGGHEVAWGTWWRSLLNLVWRNLPNIPLGIWSCCQVPVSTWPILSGGVLGG